VVWDGVKNCHLEELRSIKDNRRAVLLNESYMQAKRAASEKIGTKNAPKVTHAAPESEGVGSNKRQAGSRGHDTVRRCRESEASREPSGCHRPHGLNPCEQTQCVNIQVNADRYRGDCSRY
jgi:hypothetical protein